MLAFGECLGAGTLATGHYARIAEADHERGPLLRAAADPAKDQTYMLAALAPQVARADAISARRAAQAAGPRARGCGRAAGREQGRFPGPVLSGGDQPRPVPGPSRRPGRPARRARRHDRRDRRASPRSASLHGRPAARDRDQPRRAAVRARQGRRSQRVLVGPAEALQTTRVALRGARLHRSGSRVDRVKLRYRSRALPARLDGALAPGHHRRATLQLAEGGQRRGAWSARVPARR